MKVGAHWDGSVLEVGFSASTLEEFEEQVWRARVFAQRIMNSPVEPTLNPTASQGSDIKGYQEMVEQMNRIPGSNAFVQGGASPSLDKDRYGL